MSDEALNAHLDWLDKCAKEQINECVKHEFMCATNEYLKCKYCPETLHPAKAEAILNEHAAPKRENEGLRELFIDLLATQGLVTAKREVEIPEELSATLDIGLPLARRIVDALLTAEEQE